MSLETGLVFAALLLIASVLASRVSAVVGVPSLLMFLAVGMLAGSDGPGGIEFSNYSLAFAIGSVALALILFDGGLRTRWENARPVLGVGISLSTLGVAVTAAATAVFARYALGLSWSAAALLGSMVSSTDAAAVFSVLRSKNLSLRGRLERLLEFEAASNDPTAILFTLAALAYATDAGATAGSLGYMFSAQILLGFALGWSGGRATAWLINRAGVEYEGLYSVLLLACVLLLFAGTSALGGSGFLAVYLAGIVLGNRELLHKLSLFKFHDGIAWIAQIILFLTLGLLAFPSQLPALTDDGLLLAAFLMLVARPLSVLVAAPTLLRNWREWLFVSWVGLRGGAPIMLATLPWTVGLPGAEHYFHLVFFVVLVTVTVQGSTIAWLARTLDLVGPLPREPDALAGLLPPGFVSIEIEVQDGVPAANQRLLELGLPAGALLVSVERGDRFIVPSGDTRFQVGDTVRALARPSNVAALERIFGDVRLAH
jgi:cell volume regulation protein A